MENENKPTARLSDGLIRQNIVLMLGMLIAPVAAGATTLENSVVLSLAFTIISFFTILFCRFVSRKIVYTVRIIAYVIMASIIYIPVYILIDALFGEAAIASVGVYLPILVANPLILAKTESRFYLRPIGTMLVDVLLYIAGFDLVCILVGIIREILIYGRINAFGVTLNYTVPALETTFGGFLLIGVMAGLFRAIYNRARRRGGSDDDNS